MFCECLVVRSNWEGKNSLKNEKWSFDVFFDEHEIEERTQHDDTCGRCFGLLTFWHKIWFIVGTYEKSYVDGNQLFLFNLKVDSLKWSQLHIRSYSCMRDTLVCRLFPLPLSLIG